MSATVEQVWMMGQVVRHAVYHAMQEATTFLQIDGKSVPQRSGLTPMRNERAIRVVRRGSEMRFYADALLENGWYRERISTSLDVNDAEQMNTAVRIATEWMIDNHWEDYL